MAADNLQEIEVTIVQLPPRRFAGIDRHYAYSEMAEIPGQWSVFSQFLGRIPGQIGRAAYGLVRPVQNTGIRYAAVVEVGFDAEIPDSLTEISVAGGSFMSAVHMGHVSTLCETIAKVHACMGEAAPTGVMLEEYGMDFDPVSASGRVGLLFEVGGEQ